MAAHWEQYSYGIKYILSGAYQCYWGNTRTRIVKFNNSNGKLRICIMVTMECSHQRDVDVGNGSQCQILNLFPLDGKYSGGYAYNTVYLMNQNKVYIINSADTSVHNTEYKDALKLFDPGATNIEFISYDDLAEEILNNFTSFHKDPVYIEATKLKYVDGTYNFAKGNITSDQARKKAYKYLLNTYGTFYKGTEQELANSFATGLDNPAINGGGGNKE